MVCVPAVIYNVLLMVAASERGAHVSKPAPDTRLANPAVPAFKNPLRSIYLLLVFLA
jgi:hypothetical protein